jgi:hypothetical protein
MTLLRSIVVLLALLAQAWPALVMSRRNAGEKCQMGCCAWLAEAGMDSCGCTGASQPSEPADLPPEGVRQSLAQLVWAVSHGAEPAMWSPRNSVESNPRLDECNLVKAPHVRLPVLFCSLLN